MDEPVPIPIKATFWEKNPVLKNKEFLYFLWVRALLIFCLNMQSTTVYYWIYRLTNDKLKLGYVGLAEVIPAVVCSLFAGYLVDLSEKRNLLVKVLSGYIVLGAGLFVLTLPMTQNHIPMSWLLTLIYTFIFLGGVIRSFLGPTLFSLVGLIVPRGQYPNAVSWSSMVWQVGSVLGPLFAGLAIAWKGVEASMSTVVVMELILLVPTILIKKKPLIKSKKEPILQSLSVGLRFVFKTPILLGAMTLDMFSVLFGGAVALLPVYQKEILHVDERGFGLLRGAPGIGALIMLVILAFFPLKKYPGKKLFVAVFGFGVSIIVFGISRNFMLSFFMLVLSGMCDAISVVIRGTVMQLYTPDDMRGRVSAVNTMFISSSNELGDFESGLMAHWLGTVRAVVVGGCLTLSVVVSTFFLSKPLRDFRFDEKKKE
ncbi:MAG: MFS transporter [Chitinophagaceae bacterium]